MKLMMLIYEAPEDLAKRTDPAQQPAYGAAWMAYARALAEAGVVVSGSGLQAPGTGTTLRLRDGRRHVQDGPFADTKEQLGGYFILEVSDLDTALDLAARCPAVTAGGIELRPLLG